MPTFLPGRILLLVLALTLTACGGTDAVPPTQEEDAGVDTTDSVLAPPTELPTPVGRLPETKQDTILLEGMPEPITLKLFRSPEGFELPFYTYYPADLVPQVIPSETGQIVRFIANFGGVMTEEAFVEFFVYPPGTTLQTAREQLEATAEGLTRSPEADRRYPWSVEEYIFAEGDRVGRYILGEHGGRFFRVLITYPVEMGDGFPPRAQIVLDQLRWLDDGSGLQ